MINNVLRKPEAISEAEAKVLNLICFDPLIHVTLHRMSQG